MTLDGTSTSLTSRINGEKTDTTQANTHTIHTLLLAAAANSMFARLGTDYEMKDQWFFAILEAMTTD